MLAQPIIDHVTPLSGFTPAGQLPTCLAAGEPSRRERWGHCVRPGVCVGGGWRGYRPTTSVHVCREFLVSLLAKLTKFATTPQGRRMIDQAKRAASDPENRRKVEQVARQVRTRKTR